MSRDSRLSIQIQLTQVDNGYAVRYERRHGYSTDEEKNTVHETLDGALQAIRHACAATENALLLPASTEET